MPRFNFTNITKQSRADIEDVMDNFDKIEELGITDEEVLQRHYTKEQTDGQNENFALKSQMIYSTDETNTGEIWIDDKPIYRKTFTGTTIPSSQQSIDISGLNVDTIFFKEDRSYLRWSYGAEQSRKVRTYSTNSCT